MSARGAGHRTGRRFRISGTGTTATVNENLGYAGSLDEGARSTLSIASSDILTLTGTSSLAGTVSGAGTLALADGQTAFDSGATLTIASVSISGTGTTATVNGNLSYAGSLNEGAGSTLSIASGDILTLTGTSSLAGTVSGAGTLALADGQTAFDSGATLTIASVSISGTGTTATVNENLSYAGSLNEGTGSTLSIASDDILTLTGTSSLAGTVSGAGTLSLAGGRTAFDSGATLTIANVSVFGTGTTATVNENLSYAGSLNEGAGSTLRIATGDKLTLTGPSNGFAGAITGAGALLLAGGTTTLKSGATASVADFSESGAGTMLTLAEILGYAGDFSEGAGSTLSIKTGDKLTLTGPSNSFAGAITGVGALLLAGGTTTLKSGATVSVADFSESGARTMLTLAEILGYAGDFSEGAGSTLSIKAGDKLTLTGSSNSFAGAITGAGALLLAGGTTTLKIGATASVADFSESGARTMLTLAEILTYAGDFSEGAGSTLSIKTGDKLTLTGTSSFSGTVSGAGRLALAGGSTTIASGAELSVADWTVSGARTHVALDENLTYAGTFSAGSGATLNLSGGNFVLTGVDDFAGATTSGSHILYAEGTTTISGLTIGGTTTFENTNTLRQTGGKVTVGDASGDVAKLINASTGTWDILDDSGIGRGSSIASSISNAGLFEKSGGKGTSAITSKINNTGAIAVTSGTLDLQGAVTGAGIDTVLGNSTLEFNSTVSGNQIIDFAGGRSVVDLIDPHGFSGQIENFALPDAVDLSGDWVFSGFSENSGGSLGTLTLAKGATHLSLNFIGDYTARDFAISSGTTTVIGHA